MESDFQQHRYHVRDHHPSKQMNSGLTRYQSAPSSYFSSFGDRESLEEFLHRPTSPETERILSGFLQTTSDGGSNVDSFLHQSFAGQNSSNTFPEKKPPEIKTEEQTNFPASMEGNYDETMEKMHLKPSSSVSISQNLCQNQRQQGRDDRSSANRTMGSSLARHNSSPAGFFSSIDVESAYAAAMRSMGDNVNTGNKEASSVTPRSRPPPSPSRLMTPISETDTKPCFSRSLLPKTLSGGLKRSSGIDSSLLNTLSVGDRTLSGGLYLSETKDVGTASRPPLAHHRSLPKSLSDIEKLLSDSVPCKIRAKRGCATHPRSIAERVRRTKISERMKKLQDLVPNMDKQTNTAAMLDLAVEYIKDLQRQVKALLESQARCACSSRWL